MAKCGRKKKIKNCSHCNKEFCGFFNKQDNIYVDIRRRKFCFECVPYRSRIHSRMKSNYTINWDTKQKRCSHCKIFKDFNNFYQRKTGYLDGMCKQCIRQYTNFRGVKAKIKCLEYKGNKCIRCGYDKCIAALDFHHIEEKDFIISDRRYILNDEQFEILKKELDKCIVLCANCHREEHFYQSQLELQQSQNGPYEPNL